MSPFTKILSSKKILLALFFMLLQGFYFAVLFSGLFISRELTLYIGLGFYILSLIVCMVIINREDSPSYKLAWIFIILFCPILGSFLYLIAGRKRMSRRLIRRLDKLNELSNPYLTGFKNEDNKLSEYILKNSGFPSYICHSKFFSNTTKLMDDIFSSLNRAEKYIFIEFFIFERGKFFDTMFEILKRKVKSGVEVKIIYDSLGCAGRLSRRTVKKLRKAKIQILPFNSLNGSKNAITRTHRKIIVVDGNIAYTGGINISDEYVNLAPIRKNLTHGSWRDCAIRFEGKSVQSANVMFLRLWFMLSKEPPVFDKYLSLSTAEDSGHNSSGIIQPFSDGPDTPLLLCKSIFLKLISSAEKCVYISTPYLLLDNELICALEIAALSGVDVKILMPHIPDKKIIFAMSRSFYPCLSEAGVKIYEYTAGFNHAKTVTVDSKVAYVGSCNFDNRSFYTSFENGVMLYDSSLINEIENDFLNTITDSEEITPKKIRGINIFTRIYRSFLRFFSPLV